MMTGWNLPYRIWSWWRQPSSPSQRWLYGTEIPAQAIVAVESIFRRPLIFFNLPCFEKHLLVLQVRFRTDTWHRKTSSWNPPSPLSAARMLANPPCSTAWRAPKTRLCTTCPAWPATVITDTAKSAANLISSLIPAVLSRLWTAGFCTKWRSRLCRLSMKPMPSCFWWTAAPVWPRKIKSSPTACAKARVPFIWR